MPPLSVTAEIRSQTGKNAARRLRAAGKIPSILYGHQEDSVALSVNPKELSAILHSGTGHNTIFSLEIQGRRTTRVMIKDWQFDPIKENLLHADLIRIAMDKTLQVKVPITTVGEATGVKVQGGIFEFVLREVEVECLPSDIPEHITIDISNLEIGANFRVSDLPVDPKIKILSEADLVVAHVIAPKEEKAPEPVVEAVVAEPEVIKKGKVAEEGEEEEAKPEEKKEKKPEEKKEKK
ncbi:MAG: 50S ribosomal protein L25 [Acidobacteria bacterium]|nr:MAG: 50S ribosomal protein L25 [Acidobacteriota bacterium]